MSLYKVLTILAIIVIIVIIAELAKTLKINIMKHIKELSLQIRKLSSTQAQNNFGQVLDEIQNHRCYIIERRGTPKAVTLSFSAFVRILTDAKERHEIESIIKDFKPRSDLGQIVSLKGHGGNNEIT